MPVCVACGLWGVAPLCRRCRRSLGLGPHIAISPKLQVDAGLRHSGAARKLVHRMKYEGSKDAVRLLAAFMSTRVPGGTSLLVPVPRAIARRLRYGNDPATDLARELSRRTGIPMVRALGPALWWPRHTNADRRAAPRFRGRITTPAGAVLIDDVITTGATMLAAADVLGVTFAHGLTATAPGRMARQAVEVPSGTGEVA